MPSPNETLAATARAAVIARHGKSDRSPLKTGAVITLKDGPLSYELGTSIGVVEIVPYGTEHLPDPIYYVRFGSGPRSKTANVPLSEMRVS